MFPDNYTVGNYRWVRWKSYYYYPYKGFETKEEAEYVLKRLLKLKRG
jgi:hypothetical protein